MRINKIEISFPDQVNVRTSLLLEIEKAIKGICADYMNETPESIMWPADHGAKPTGYSPDGVPVEFDESVYCIDCRIRPNLTLKG